MQDAKVFPAPRRLSLPAGERIFAIGDIHGRLDLFVELLKTIASTEERQGPTSRIVVLGDVVDRGPSSRALVERFMRYTRATPNFVVLKGNHERMMTQALRGNLTAFRQWLDFGGDATLRSWGVDLHAGGGGSAFQLIKQARAKVGEDVLAWLEALPTSFRCGDVLFVHAGIRPGVALEGQDEEDLLWIRHRFIDSVDDHGALIVHGHTVTADGPVVRANRIGVDTGAYKTGVLSAVCLEEETLTVFRT